MLVRPIIPYFPRQSLGPDRLEAAACFNEDLDRKPGSLDMDIGGQQALGFARNAEIDHLIAHVRR